MKDKSLKSVLLMIIAVMTILGIGVMIRNDVKAIEGQSNNNNNGQTTQIPSTLVEGEIDPTKYAYNTDTGEWEAIHEGGFAVPLYANYEIYCIEPGGRLTYKYDIRYATAQELDGKKYSGHCHCAPTPHEDDESPIVYRPAGTQELPVAAAYIISGEPIGKWSEDKQRAIWNLRYMDVDGKSANEGLVKGSGNSASFGCGPSKYDQEAEDYANYDVKVRDQGLNPENKTELNDVYTKINQGEKEYIVGPFELDYTHGFSGDVYFSGISEMVVLGYNKKGEQVRDDIEIERFSMYDGITGAAGESAEPEFFEPSEDLKTDNTEQVYPKPGEKFEIIFKDPNEGLSGNDENRVAAISIKVKFKYMLAYGEYTELNGTQYTVEYSEQHKKHRHCYRSGRRRRCYNCYDCKTGCYLSTDTNFQTLMSTSAIRVVFEQELELTGEDGTPFKIDTTMDLGGHVWEDAIATKEDKADGISTTEGDKPLQNVKVTLFEEGNDQEPATLLSDPEEEGISEGKVMHRVNPTYTDEDGNYLFEGLDPMRKYYVTFQYNGQTYLPTEYLNTAGTQYSSVEQMVNAGLYNTDEWKVTSKGTEPPEDRDEFDKRFEEIGSYPENYISKDTLGVAKNGKNAAFTKKDLMGYELSSSGKYQKNGEQLIDGYLYDEDGNQTEEYSTEGVIPQKVREFIQANKKFPDEGEMQQIYSEIAGGDKELLQKLQFIEDCYIDSHTQAQGGEHDLYPVYDEFKINHAKDNVQYETALEAQNGEYDMTEDVIDGVTYRPIYPGQFFINQGLWRRQEFDTAIRKDVFRAVMKINDKTVMYKYKRPQEEEEGANKGDGKDNNTYWDINVRVSDDKYYNAGYNRELYLTDYEYSSKSLNHPGADLEMYVTYKITVRNQSMSVISQIKELVDYYDKDYTYKDNLSWVIYKSSSGAVESEQIDDDTYYKMMSNKQNAMDSVKATDYVTTKGRGSKGAIKAKAAKGTTKGSKYGASTHSDVTRTYGAVYVSGLENKPLATGESAYIYLTFQVNKSNGKIILDEESSPKMNIAEINGYKTYYRDGTQLPNGISKGSKDIAGLLDRDSNPGNLVQKDISDNDRYEKNFEDDTDRAPGLRVLIDNEAVRKANGTVWEDQRGTPSGSAMIGDGIRQNNEVTVAGVTVQLVEKTVDGKEYIWQEKTTDDKGYYSFESYIPGDYIIRFKYGNTVDTVQTKKDGGRNDVSYNGQDFKSTTYQKTDKIKQNDYTDESNRYKGYTNPLDSKQNETGVYNNSIGYNIYQADAAGVNVSDAKDIWSRRQQVINYSNKDVTNHKAEVLASPYTGMKELINELIQNTNMIAETGVIAVEFEYDRQQSEGAKDVENNRENSSKDYVLESNRKNGGYELKDIDFGLVERPKAQLEIDKSITNIRVTLADGTDLFDARQSQDNVIWKDHEEYNLGSKKNNQGKYNEYYDDKGKDRYSYRDEVEKLVKRTDKGLIQLTMDEELMHGADIEITYQLKVTNVGEVDYEGEQFYYLGTGGSIIVTTQANQVADYVANNLKFDSSNAKNNGWGIIQTNNLLSQDLVNARLTDSVRKFNNIIQTEGLNKLLKPGEKTDKTLVLIQKISTENTSDDLTYSNLAEIVKTSNTVGRRMAYSIVGNQDPTASQASEVDSSLAERVIILPPFGNAHIYYILGAVVAIILIGGITLIIRKVLKK